MWGLVAGEWQRHIQPSGQTQQSRVHWLPPFSFPPTLFVYGNGGTQRSVAREDPGATPQRDRMPITPHPPHTPNELYADGGSLESRQCP